MTELFKNPQAVYLLLLAPFVVALYWWQYKTRSARLQGRFPVRVYRSTSVHVLKAMACCLAWVLIVFALMQPVANPRYQRSEQSVTTTSKNKLLPDVIVMLDASASMTVSDARQGKTRFEYSKDLIDTLAQQLSGGNIALIGFTAEATTLAPMTMDLFYVRQQAKGAQINVGDVSGTDLATVLTHVKQDVIPGTRRPLILLFSDGEDTKLAGMTGEAKSSATQAILEAARSTEIPIYTIGVGTTSGGEVPQITFEGKPVHSALDEELLQKISASTEATYYRAADYSLGSLADGLAQVIEQRATRDTAGTSTAEQQVIYDQLFQYPLAVALLLLLFIRYFPDARSLSLLLLFFSTPLFSQPDEMRQAEAYYQAGDLAAAEQIYAALLASDMPAWQKAIVHYNSGTIQLESGEWEQAVSSFQEALLVPGSPDFFKERALHNLALAFWRLAVRATQTLATQSDPMPAAYAQAISYARLSISQHQEAKCLLAELLPAYYKNILQHAAPREGLLFLLEGSNTSAKRGKFLQSIKENKTLHDDFAKVYIEEAESWLPLWEKMSKDIENTKYQSDFAQAHAAFRSALPQLNPELFEKAAEFLKKSLKELAAFVETITTVKQVLQNAIEQQQFILILMTLGEKSYEDMLKIAQSSLADTLNTFYPAVMLEQTTTFQAGKCAYQPWDGVIPLFEKGRQANDGMEAIQAWKAALTKLAEPTTGQSCPQQGSGGGKSDDKQTNAPSLTDVLKRLQEMEGDDKLTEPSSVFIQKGERPW